MNWELVKACTVAIAYLPEVRLSKTCWDSAVEGIAIAPHHRTSDRSHYTICTD
ncbi:hypothetical protein [Nostoc sphaeroides]|uniref:Uncharacterized protein n=1 Tax=Nostoc sphaeroides CCNUC1 TaxID=2653204 RepID=A0A5P8VZU4_9NOSO|nr:hypothetical protein [Nostoc sphaeroides]MCC5630147.1 hypothetical protein [Nostoc sphaeroides CHAB 2801]QFS45937.1 hypothetical protein GXM_03416 [Nostoc sphaeroides CCNUC1]